MEQSVITRTVMVAPGRFAPGHLGELTQQVPFELVDAVLSQTGRLQSRVRDLPARVVVYLLLAGWLFAELGYGQVWQRLCAGLDGLKLATPTASALTKARRRLGPAPLRALFALLAGPAPMAATAGVRVGGLLVCAIDGTTLSVADTPANLAAYAKHSCHNGGSGYPLLRLVALVACGTRSLIDVAYGPTSSGETTMCQRLVASLGPGMLVLCDRNLTTNTLIGRIAATNAHLLGRCKTDRKLPVLGRLGDGSWLSVMGGVTVRVIQAEITITTGAGRASGSYRLATTLTDPAPGRRPRWSRCTTSAGRSRPPTWNSSPASWAAGCYAPAPPPASTKRSTPYWSATSSYAWPWPMPPAAKLASTLTGPASPSPCRPPATSSSRPPA